MMFKLRSGARVKFTDDAVDTLLRHRQTGAEHAESGGLLLGRIIPPNDDLVVDIATAPHRLDKRGRTFFVRRKAPAQRAVTKYWQDSAGTINYLGEWHTHPERVPSPSSTDKNDWRRIVRRAKYPNSILLFCIVGISQNRLWELGPDDLIPSRAEQLIR